MASTIATPSNVFTLLFILICLGQQPMRKFLLVCYFSSMFSIVFAQLESWSGWAELDSDQQIALLDEMNEWLDHPLHVRSVTWSNLNDLPISATSRDRIWTMIKSEPNLTLQDVLKSLDSASWDYAVLSAVVTDNKIAPRQHYRLRIINGAGKNDQQYRQTLSARVNQFQILGLVQRQAGDDSFLQTLSGGLLHESPDATRRIYLGNYRLDFGLGLAIRQSAFVSGNSLSQILPSIKQRVKLHQSAQNYGYFRGIAYQKKYQHDTFQVLAFFSQMPIRGKMEGSTFRPYPASQSEDLLFRTETTFGTSLIYRNEKNTVVQAGILADQLASAWRFPIEIDLTQTIGHLMLTYGSGWSGGDTLVQIAGLQLDGKTVRTALSFWHLGWIGKSVYRLSAPNSAMERENTQGASMGFHIQVQPGMYLDISSWFHKPVVLMGLAENGWKQGFSLRLTWRQGNVFWRLQKSETVTESHKISVQFTQHHEKSFVLNEVFKITRTGDQIGGMAGLRWQHKLEKWQTVLGVARFVAEDFTVRQYAYESDVTNAFSVPLYYGNGARMYLLERFKGPFWSMEFKVGQWREYRADGTSNKFDGTLQLSIVL